MTKQNHPTLAYGKTFPAQRLLQHLWTNRLSRREALRLGRYLLSEVRRNLHTKVQYAIVLLRSLD
jgi:hypothetical protein